MRLSNSLNVKTETGFNKEGKITMTNRKRQVGGYGDT